MEIVRDKRSMLRRALEFQRRGTRLAAVPTMGALHRGHLSLLDVARPGCDLVAATIFINPLQFGAGEDLERYPRDLDGDARQLEAAGCDLLFAPAAEDMFGSGIETSVDVGALAEPLCGRFRAGHFRGVTTIVTKLFHVLQPAVAVFGQKDAQQAIVLRRMVRDLDFPVELRFGDIVRDPDGLALSSRNAYLSDAQRTEALLLHESLAAARDLLDRGERRSGTVCTRVREVLERGATLRVEYVELVDTEHLRRVERAEGRVLLALAAHVGETRLIDNAVFDVQGEHVRKARLES